MKLLFDQNISPRIVTLLAPLFPQCSHVRGHRLHDADDDTVWNFARHHGFTIVSKDADFHQRSFLYGHPPKIIWLKAGNCSTADIESLLRKHAQLIQQFHRDEEASFLALAF